MNDTVKARPFTVDELRAYLIEIFPEFWKDGDLRVEDIAPMSATVRLIHHPKHLRPGRDDFRAGDVRSLRRRAVRGDLKRDRSRRACGHHERFDQFPPQTGARRSHRQGEAD
jgi:hypothetical protein